MSNIKLAYITCKNNKEANQIATKLINNNLIACANIVSNIQSIFKWKSKLIKNKETILLAKTKKSKTKDIVNMVSKIHSYENPCVVFFDVEEGSKQFLTWVNQCLK